LTDPFGSDPFGSIHARESGRSNPWETIQGTMENFIDAFELFFRDELEGEIAKQSNSTSPNF
jgi:hypothetical protein